MNCPCCDFEGSWRGLHRHLAESHGELVEFTEQPGRSSYQVVCPVCGDGYEQAVKPRLADPEFLAEYREEIRLVAFDTLLHHLAGEHLEAGDTDPIRPADGEG